MAVNPPNPELAALPDLFLLDLKNRAYVDGKARLHLETGRWSTVFLFAAFFAVLFTAAAIYFGDAARNVLLFSVLLSLVALWCLWQMRRGGELVRDGQLLMGEVVDYQVKEGYETEFGGHYYYAELNFSVRVSDRRLIENTTTKEIPDYKSDLFIPPPGTPLAVLYAHEKLYEVL